MYPAAVVDVASRGVLAHKVAIKLEACHATEVIKQTLARYGTPAIMNIDQGSQFAATEFTEVVLGAGCQLSMDGVARGGTTCLSSGYGAPSSTSTCTNTSMPA